MLGFLSLFVIDWMMQQVTKRKCGGINWGWLPTIENLDFADDLVLLSETSKQMQRKTDELVKLAAKSGLRVSKPKTKVLRLKKSTVYNQSQ